MMRRLSSVATFDAPSGTAHYLEHLRVDSMSVGIYSIPASAADPQSPHAEDELYFVIRGRASFTAEGETIEVGPGDALFVAAGERHRFHDVTEDLVVMVVFAPPESAVPH